ncbi:LysE family transporter, partial [Mycobacterium hackensackense]|uniref:LysE/ArgO family amino acid transporter n=1 Tax=Mycobacterium hackensackense TaxID=228909 RepID=UPI002265B0B0
MSSPVLLGFLTTMALIAYHGAQNAFVLRQGIRGEHVVPVIALCTVSDLILIAAGIAGVGALVTAHPDAMTVAKLGGAVFLIGYGALAARRAFRPAALNPSERGRLPDRLRRAGCTPRFPARRAEPLR